MHVSQLKKYLKNPYVDIERFWIICFVVIRTYQKRFLHPGFKRTQPRAEELLLFPKSFVYLFNDGYFASK